MNKRQIIAPPKLVFWALWLVMLANVPLLYLFLGKTEAHESPLEESLPYLRVLPFALSCLVRWAVLPQMRSLEAVFPVFVIGIALAEASCLLGIFLFPTYKADMLIMAMIGVAQFAPVFVRKFECKDAR